MRQNVIFAMVVSIKTQSIVTFHSGGFSQWPPIFCRFLKCSDSRSQAKENPTISNLMQIIG